MFTVNCKHANKAIPDKYSKCVSVRERYTIAAFRREPAGPKGERLFNECCMNVTLVWDFFRFLSVITPLIPISSATLRSYTIAARFKLCDLDRSEEWSQGESPDFKVFSRDILMQKYNFFGRPPSVTRRPTCGTRTSQFSEIHTYK